MLNDLELKKLVKFFQILQTIDRRINSNFSASQIREVGNKNKNGSEKIYRHQTNKRISRTNH
jgi:diadenosine tetraphosphate (Ap4A) HIT family hydrolase